MDAGTEAGLDKHFTPITTEAPAQAQPDVILMMTKGLDSVGGLDGVLPSFGPRTPLVIDILLTSSPS